MKKIDLLNLEAFKNFDVNVFKLFPKLQSIGLAEAYFDLLIEIIRLKLPCLNEIIFYGNALDSTMGVYYDLENRLKSQSDIFKMNLKVQYDFYKNCYVDVEHKKLSFQIF